MEIILKLGILGGTFNPIHNAHLIIAEQMRDELKLDKIFFIPTYIPPHKNISSDYKITDKDRLEMVKLAIKNNPNFELCTYELERKGISYTYHTLKYLYDNFEIDDKIYVIIGADLIPELYLWYKYNEIIEICRFVVFNRNKININSYISEQYPFLQIIKSNIGMDISSTEIRNRVQEKKSIKYLVPNCVENYIKEKKLYSIRML